MSLKEIKKTTPQAELRQPDIVPPHDIDVPLPETLRLSNGVNIYTLDCSDLDVIRVSFVFRAGTSMQLVPFSASATANLLCEGSKLHDAKHIAERLDFFGSYYDVTLDRDYSVITFASLSKYFQETMEVAREILLTPAFDENEISVYCDKRKQRLSVERSKVSFKARELFSRALFGKNHPYGESFSEEYYDNLKRKDLTDFYDRFYTAGSCFAVASGKIGENEKRVICSLAENFPSGDKNTGKEFPVIESTRSIFESHEHALQSAIRIGRVLFPRTHPDFVAMQVLTTILGGYFGSRLVENLREKHGYTYGVFAGMVNMEYEGYIAIATEVASGATFDAVAQIYLEIERLREEMVGEEELQTVKNIMMGEVMRILDGPFGIADVTIENIQNRTDNSYLSLFIQEVSSITPERLSEVAKKYLDGKLFSTVVVGHPSLSEYFSTMK